MELITIMVIGVIVWGCMLIKKGVSPAVMITTLGAIIVGIIFYVRSHKPAKAAPVQASHGVERIPTI